MASALPPHSHAAASLPRPPLPPESICRMRDRRPLKWLMRPPQRTWVLLQEANLVPNVRLQRHVVMCGFPRSGTTLCQLMVQSCVSGIRHFPEEVRALHAARYARRTQPIMLTKRPRDLFAIEELRAFYRDRPTDVCFVVFHRDPRAVLTSKHADRPGEYYVDVARWRAIYEHWQWARHQPDAIAISYEELTSRPDDIQQRLTGLAGWSDEHPFSDFCSVAQRKFDMSALNGLRAPDPANIDRWRSDEYHARIRTLLQDMPELPERLIEMGYEPDSTWTGHYRQPLPASVRRSAA